MNSALELRRELDRENTKAFEEMRPSSTSRLGSDAAVPPPEISLRQPTTADALTRL